MKAMHRKNRNAPGKGANVTVDPIRNLKDIQVIAQSLDDKTRDKLLFIMGINNGIRITDLLKLKVQEVRSARVGDIIRITETKTRKGNVLVINAQVHKALQEYLQNTVLSDKDFLLNPDIAFSFIESG